MRDAARSFDGTSLVHRTVYDLWDADSMQTCVCDPGWSGFDCSKRSCPVGDDPLWHGVRNPRISLVDAPLIVTAQKQEIQSIRTTAQYVNEAQRVTVTYSDVDEVRATPHNSHVLRLAV